MTRGWNDISGPDPASFSSRSSMYYGMLILQNPIKSLNVISTDSFFGAFNCKSPTTLCKLELRPFFINRNNFSFCPILFIISDFDISKSAVIISAEKEKRKYPLNIFKCLSMKIRKQKLK